MDVASETPRQPLGRWLREPVNTLTHGLGALLGVVGLVVLLVLSEGEPWRTVAFSVYGASLIALYLASSVMHGAIAPARVIRRLRILDHAAIFLLIAGTYTPITLVALRSESPGWGWALFGTAWGFAALGIVFKLFWLDAPRWLSVAMYIAMGWMAMVGIVPMVQALPWGALTWLLIGGLFYSFGALIYALKRPDPWPKVFGYHEIWHLFVLAGSASHFVMMVRYILPA
ncbi:MAG: hemolysin III family protein [Trueperaceae bacterium]|nr:hemolysin III family protein [Trueperaceae bacterium]